jgi:hypothetical protein
VIANEHKLITIDKERTFAPERGSEEIRLTLVVQHLWFWRYRSVRRQPRELFFGGLASEQILHSDRLRWQIKQTEHTPAPLMIDSISRGTEYREVHLYPN